nr:MAG TPA: hypothetical protein [Caudoviricetes sp.]
MGNQKFDDYNPFSVCFNALRMKYQFYDESLTSANFLNPTDKVNVFVNLESVFKHLSMLQDLERKIILQKDFVEIIISDIINLAGFYKRFFKGNGLDTKVYLFHTDFKSEDFIQRKYNEDYRSYYLTKFNKNPKFVLFTEKLINEILPDVRTLCEFIPDVYYISSNNIEGSLIPYIIGKDDSRKNLLITGELYDTQYSLIDNFNNHYIHRSFSNQIIASNVTEYLSYIAKATKEDVKTIEYLYDSHSLYCTLLSVIGDKSRSIDGVCGYGFKSLSKLIYNGIKINIIRNDTTNPQLIGTIFDDEEDRKAFITNYNCTSILSLYKELTEADITSINNQICDRIDMNSLISLNADRFYNHQINLESLFS